jgi:hypothetical protein
MMNVAVRRTPAVSAQGKLLCELVMTKITPPRHKISFIVQLALRNMVLETGKTEYTHAIVI